MWSPWTTSNIFTGLIPTYDRDIYFSSPGISSDFQMHSFGCFLDVLNAISVAFQAQFKMNTWSLLFCTVTCVGQWPCQLSGCTSQIQLSSLTQSSSSSPMSITKFSFPLHYYYSITSDHNMSPRLLQQPFNRFPWTFRFFQVIPVHWIADLISSPLPTTLKSQWLFPGVPNSPEDKDHLENLWKRFSGAQYRSTELEFPEEMSSNLVTKQQFQWFLPIGKKL